MRGGANPSCLKSLDNVHILSAIYGGEYRTSHLNGVSEKMNNNELANILVPAFYHGMTPKQVRDGLPQFKEWCRKQDIDPKQEITKLLKNKKISLDDISCHYYIAKLISDYK